jgi:hypothetical protein
MEDQEGAQSAGRGGGGGDTYSERIYVLRGERLIPKRRRYVWRGGGDTFGEEEEICIAG